MDKKIQHPLQVCVDRWRDGVEAGIRVRQHDPEGVLRGAELDAGTDRTGSLACSGSLITMTVIVRRNRRRTAFRGGAVSPASRTTSRQTRAWNPTATRTTS